jgi:hypothetical protein
MLITNSSLLWSIKMSHVHQRFGRRLILHSNQYFYCHLKFFRTDFLSSSRITLYHLAIWKARTWLNRKVKVNRRRLIWLPMDFHNNRRNCYFSVDKWNKPSIDISVLDKLCCQLSYEDAFQTLCKSFFKILIRSAETTTNNSIISSTRRKKSSKFQVIVHNIKEMSTPSHHNIVCWLAWGQWYKYCPKRSASIYTNRTVMD